MGLLDRGKERELVKAGHRCERRHRVRQGDIDAGPRRGSGPQHRYRADTQPVLSRQRERQVVAATAPIRTARPDCVERYAPPSFPPGFLRIRVSCPDLQVIQFFGPAIPCHVPLDVVVEEFGKVVEQRHRCAAQEIPPDGCFDPPDQRDATQFTKRLGDIGALRLRFVRVVISHQYIQQCRRQCEPDLERADITHLGEAEQSTVRPERQVEQGDREDGGRQDDDVAAKFVRGVVHGFLKGFLDAGQDEAYPKLLDIMAVMSIRGKYSNKYDGKNDAGYGKIACNTEHTERAGGWTGNCGQ